jgi:uncharacterized protein YaaW (UPF0174 family)
MATGPWEKYGAPQQEGPWSKFAEPSATAQMPPTTPQMTAPTGGVPVGRQPMSWGKVATEAVSNLGPSAYKQGEGLVSAVLSPIDTLKTLGKLGGGAALNIMPDKAREIATSIFTNPQSAKEAMDLASSVGGEYATNYGTLEGFKQKLASDPVGVLADLSTLFYGGGAVVKGAGLTKTGGAISKVGSAIDPLNIVTAPIRIPIESSLKKTMPAAQTANAVRDANIASAQAAGYTLTPGSITPTGKNILAERVAGKTNLEQLASVKNQTVTDRLVRESLGLPESAPLTSSHMKDIRTTEYNKGYEPIKQVGQVPTDPKFVDDLVNIESKYVGANASFPGAIPPDVEKLIKTYTVDKFDSKDAINASRTLRDEASANFRKGENAVAKAQLDVANALENQIERHLINTGRPDAHTILEQFKLSRQRMAVSHTVENAIREGSGSVDAKKLAGMLQRGDYMTGELKTAAEFANVFPRVSNMPSQIGTPAAGSVLGQGLFAGTAAGGVGSMYGGVTGGLTGAAIGLAPSVISSGMRRYLLSNAGQRNLLPDYNTQIPGMTREAMRNMLLASQAGKTYQDLENRNSLRP